MKNKIYYFLQAYASEQIERQDEIFKRYDNKFNNIENLYAKKRISTHNRNQISEDMCKMFDLAVEIVSRCPYLTIEITNKKR